MPPRNPYLCFSIVVVLGTASLVGTGGIILLAIYGRTVPESLIAITTASLGALSSFLVQVPRSSIGGGNLEGK